MNFLIDLFKKASKGDNYRQVDVPDRYNDKIAQLNTVSPNQSTRLTTNNINKIQKSSTSLTQTNPKGSTLPGTV
jgi:hypothetical protein